MKVLTIFLLFVLIQPSTILAMCLPSVSLETEKTPWSVSEVDKANSYLQKERYTDVVVIGKNIVSSSYGLDLYNAESNTTRKLDTNIYSQRGLDADLDTKPALFDFNGHILVYNNREYTFVNIRTGKFEEGLLDENKFRPNASNNKPEPAPRKFGLPAGTEGLTIRSIEGRATICANEFMYGYIQENGETILWNQPLPISVPEGLVTVVHPSKIGVAVSIQKFKAMTEEVGSNGAYYSEEHKFGVTIHHNQTLVEIVGITARSAFPTSEDHGGANLAMRTTYSIEKPVIRQVSENSVLMTSMHKGYLTPWMNSKRYQLLYISSISTEGKKELPLKNNGSDRRLSQQSSAHLVEGAMLELHSSPTEESIPVTIRDRSILPL